MSQLSQHTVSNLDRLLLQLDPDADGYTTRRFPDSSESDQGATSGNFATIKDCVDDFGSDFGVIVLRHNSGDAVTNYVLDTSEILNENTFLVIEHGARITRTTGDETLTVHSPENLLIDKKQKITETDLLEFAVGGVIYPEWFGAVADDTVDCVNAFRYAVASMPSGGGCTIKLGIGTYTFGKYTVGSDHFKIYFDSLDNFALLGSGPGTVLKPLWAGGTYDPAVYGYISIYVDTCTNFEIGNFTYDNGTIDHQYPVMMRITDSSVGNIHNIYAINGNDIQDKNAIGVYSSSNLQIHHNTFEDFDANVMLTNSLSGQNIVTDNMFLGGKSEAVSIWTNSDESNQSYNLRSTVVANNYVENKNSYAFNVDGVDNAEIIFTGNAIVGSKAGGFKIDDSTNVIINANNYTGGYYFVRLTDASYVTISNNEISGGLSLVMQVSDTDPLNYINVFGNVFRGPLVCAAWNSSVAYKPGQCVTHSGVAYYCIAETTNNTPPNATYWTAFGADKIIGGVYNNSSFCNNQLFGGLAYVFDLTDPQDVHINNNSCSGIGGINIVASSGEYVEDLNISHNTFIGTTSYGMFSSGYGIKNSIITNNKFKSDVSYGIATLNNVIVQNTIFENNYIEGVSSETDLYAELYGCARKRNNSFSEDPTDRWNDTPTNGYVTVGETFYNPKPVAGGTMGSVCTTAGYGSKETYNTSNSYVVGEHVVGSDSNVYRCILDDSGSAANAPITGGSWATYWVLAGSAAVFKTFGDIAA